MDGIIMAAQMILALSIIVGIHEFGHLLAAKFFGMRVEKYFIGFPPKIFSFNYKGTEYGLGSIPLGGFVKITGIIDESMDTTHLKKEPEEWELSSKEGGEGKSVEQLCRPVVEGYMAQLGAQHTDTPGAKMKFANPRGRQDEQAAAESTRARADGDAGRSPAVQKIVWFASIVASLSRAPSAVM